MGSTKNAIVSGFVCRLCSEQKKVVIHFYTQRAKQIDLLKKLKLLPVTINRYDSLPKTICEQCVTRLDVQYNFLQKIKKSHTIHRTHRMYHSNGRCPVECPLHGLEDPSWSEITLDEAADS